MIEMSFWGSLEVKFLFLWWWWFPVRVVCVYMCVYVLAGRVPLFKAFPSWDAIGTVKHIL